MDNQILVAGGIGITPAISVMRKHAESRRSNLIWAVRDPHMLEFFVKHGSFSTRGWNLIFYTGKQPLYVGNSNEILTSSGALVHVIRSRPNIANLIPNIIYSIESGKFVPEAYVPETKVDAMEQLKDKLVELESEDVPSQEKLNQLMEFSDGLGFLFTDLMGEIVKDDPKMQDYMKKHQMIRASTVFSPASFNAISEDGEGEIDASTSTSVDPVKSRRNTRRSLGNAMIANKRMSMRGMSMRGFNPHGGPRLGRGTSTMFLGSLTSSLVGMMEDGMNEYLPWEEDSEESQMFVNDLDQEEVLGTWGCLYCGGQGPLANSLKKTADRFGISVALESFKW